MKIGRFKISSLWAKQFSTSLKIGGFKNEFI
jgi:hypothetical protein